MNSRAFGRDLRLNTGDSLHHHQGLSSGLSEQSRFEQKNVNLRSSTSSSKFVAKSVSGTTANRGSASGLERIGLGGGVMRSSRPSSPIVDEPFSPSTNHVNTSNGYFSPSIKSHHSTFGSSSSTAASAATASVAQRLNNSAANLKQISYSISSASGNSSGSQLNMFTNAAKHMFGNRGLALRSGSFEMDPLEMQFETLRLAARTARPEDLSTIASGGATANPAVGSAFSKIAAFMTDLAEQYRNESNNKMVDEAQQQLTVIQNMQNLLQRSSRIAVYGQELQRNLATLLRNVGVLDQLMQLFGDPETEESVDGEAPVISDEVTDLPIESKVDVARDDDIGLTPEEVKLTNDPEKLSEVKLDSDSSRQKMRRSSSLTESSTERQRSGSIEIGKSLVSTSPETDLKEQKQLAAVRLLGDCLTAENRVHLLDTCNSRLQGLVRFCAAEAKSRRDLLRERAAVDVLRPLLEHCEDTCRHVLLQWGGLDALLVECRTSDTCSLRSCVQALANAALFGGDQCQRRLLANDLLIWLFPLASHRDRAVKYFALLTLGILVANKELEAEVVKSGSLDLIHTLVLCSDPHEWAQSGDPCINQNGFGQSKEWLRRLVSVLDCDREEAKSIAAFHFAMEAHLKKRFGNAVMFKEINAIASLKKVASSPMAMASNFAAHALKCLGEKVPHKLSQQVALWSISDVKEWITQIDFTDYANRFLQSKVDGDLLLRLNETHLAEDIGMSNGLLRMRFMRELTHLKILAEYSNCDNSNIAKVLNSINDDYIQYTYQLINGGLDARTLQTCTKEQLRDICGIYNEIHAENIVNAFKNNIISDEIKGSLESIDAFISYRRVGGSQLASLLKVHLTLKGLKVFLDVEKLQAGKFHHNLLTSIKQARHFILVLTPHSLDRCIEDKECNDWVHKEIVEALASKCNIIPITFDFEWPSIDKLPEDMRPVIQFNAVTWSHEYQEACVEKLLRFMQEEERQRKPSTVAPQNTSGATFMPHGQAYAGSAMARYGSNPQLTSHHPPMMITGSPSTSTTSLLAKHPPTYPRATTVSPVNLHSND